MDSNSVWEEDWQAVYEAGESALFWHFKEAHPDLIKYGSSYIEGPPKRWFLPLCGKSYDLKFLYDKGHTVVGVDFTELAIKEFFKENSIQYTIKENPVKVYETLDQRLQIYVADMFDVDPSQLGTFDLIWDRGSFIVIQTPDRPKYSSFIKKVAGKNCHYLIQTTFYEGAEIRPKRGIARNVTKKHIDEFFGDTFNIMHLGITSPRWQVEGSGLPGCCFRTSLLVKN